MKPSSWDKQLGLASPLECAASQSGQTNNPSKECGGAGCKSPYPHLPEGRGEAFFLDILFHRMSEIACGCKPSRLLSQPSFSVVDYFRFAGHPSRIILIGRG